MNGTVSCADITQILICQNFQSLDKCPANANGNRGQNYGQQHTKMTVVEQPNDGTVFSQQMPMMMGGGGPFSRTGTDPASAQSGRGQRPLVVAGLLGVTQPLTQPSSSGCAPFCRTAHNLLLVGCPAICCAAVISCVPSSSVHSFCRPMSTQPHSVHSLPKTPVAHRKNQKVDDDGGVEWTGPPRCDPPNYSQL